METAPGTRIPTSVPDGTAVLLLYGNDAIHKLYDGPSMDVFGDRRSEAIRRVEDLRFSTVEAALTAARTEPGLTQEGAAAVAAIEADAAAQTLGLSDDEGALSSSAALAALMLVVLQARLAELVPAA